MNSDYHVQNDAQAVMSFSAILTPQKNSGPGDPEPVGVFESVFKITRLPHGCWRSQ